MSRLEAASLLMPMTKIDRRGRTGASLFEPHQGVETTTLQDTVRNVNTTAHYGHFVRPDSTLVLRSYAADRCLRLRQQSQPNRLLVL